MSGPGVVLDAGPFIALEKRNPVLVHLTRLLIEKRVPLVTSASVVAQVWRGGTSQQVPIAFLLRHTEVVDLTYVAARVLGRMLGLSRTSDVVDAHVVLLARERRWPVLTSDADDLLALDPGLTVERV